eukprot:scaffold141196_cov39-Prasinocladus_malaysianus.AAC.1
MCASVGEADCLLAELPELLCLAGVTAVLRGDVLKDGPAGPAGALDLALEGVVPPGGAGPAVPAPVDAGLGALGVRDGLEEALARLVLRDVSAGDILHEDREEPAEPAALLAEEGRLGDAARVHGGEGDAGLVVVAPVQLEDGHHVGQLAVFVCLGAVVCEPVDHHLLGGEAGQGAQVGVGRHGPAAHGVGVAGDGPHDDAAGLLGLLEVGDHQVDQQEVGEVVDGEALLEAVVSHGGGGLVGEVHRRVAAQDVQGAPAASELLDEGPDGVGGLELERVDAVLLARVAQLVDDPLHLLDVAHAADDVPVAVGHQALERGQAEAGRGAREDDGLGLPAAGAPLAELRLRRDGAEASRGG